MIETLSELDDLEFEGCSAVAFKFQIPFGNIIYINYKINYLIYITQKERFC